MKHGAEGSRPDSSVWHCGLRCPTAVSWSTQGRVEALSSCHGYLWPAGGLRTGSVHGLVQEMKIALGLASKLAPMILADISRQDTISTNSIIVHCSMSGLDIGSHSEGA